MTDSFYLGAYWKARQRTLREYITESKRFLGRLGALHPLLRGLIIAGKTPNSGQALLPDLSNLDALILRLAHREDTCFSHANPDGSPTLDSYCSRGFLTSYSNGTARPEEEAGITLTAGTDSPWLGNAVVIDLPMGVSEFREYGFVRRLLETVVDCWAPSRAVVSSHAFNAKLDDQGGRRVIGWMTWFDTSSVRGALPKEIESEPLAGGLLVTTTHEVLSPEAPDHVATARRIRDYLQAGGFLT